MKRASLLLGLSLFCISFSYANKPYAVTATNEEKNIYLGNFASDKIKDIYYKNDDSFQLGRNYITVNYNGVTSSSNSLCDATNLTGSGSSFTSLQNGDILELSFESTIFTNKRTIEEISFVFNTAGIRVNYEVINTPSGNYQSVLNTATTYDSTHASYYSFHNLTKLSVEEEFQSVYKIRFTFEILDSSISSFAIKELDIELENNPEIVKTLKDSKNRDISVPTIFSNHALLKHQSHPKVYGYGGGSDGSEVTVSILKDNQTICSKTAIVHNYKWSTSLDKIEAGTGYALKIQGQNNELYFSDIAFGEVYLASGQSNMQRTMEKLDGNDDPSYIWPNYATETLNPLKSNPNTNLRLFNQSGESLRNQRIQDVTSEGWNITDFDTAYHFSAVGYFFGDALLKAIDIPVGIIYAAVGGSKIQEWMDKDLLMSSSDAELLIEQQKCQNYYDSYSSAHSTESTGNYFNSMIRPLGPYTLSGVLWYQGESNAGARNYYHKLMDLLETSYRNVFDDESLTFLVCQLCPYNVSGYNHHYIANVQAEMQFILSNTFTTVIYDTVTEENESNIHPQNKKPVGERLAALAREVIYGEDIEAMCPFVSEVEFDKELAILVYDHIGSGFDNSNPITGFEVSGDGTNFYPADAIIMGNMVVVTANQVNNVTAVRYAYNRTMTGNLKTKEGLPASVYASDVLLQPITVKRVIKSLNITHQEAITVSGVNDIPTKVSVTINGQNQQVDVNWDPFELTSGTQTIKGTINNPIYMRISMEVTLNNSSSILIWILIPSIIAVCIFGALGALFIIKRNKKRRIT